MFFRREYLTYVNVYFMVSLFQRVGFLIEFEEVSDLLSDAERWRYAYFMQRFTGDMDAKGIVWWTV